MLRPQSIKSGPLACAGIACLKLVREEHRRDTQRTQSVGRDGPRRHAYELLEHGRKPVIYEKRKSTQCGTLVVVDYGEPWLELKETLDEVGR